MKKFFAVVLLLMIMIGSWSWMQYLDLRGPGIPVLLYHGVDTHGPKNKYTLDTEVFERQLQWLHDNGYKTLLPMEIKNRKIRYNPSKTVILTFDDGLLNNFQIVYPLLKKYGFTGVFFIITGEIGKSGRVTAAQLIDMSRHNMEIASHTVSHPFLDAISNAEAKYQLETSRQFLQKITGKPIYSIAPPGGWFNDTTVKLARECGYSFLFGCEIGLNDLTRTPFVFKRNEVLRGMSMYEFQALVTPLNAFPYKLLQSLKFFLHDILGSENYQKLSHAFN